ncbi:hypothetical protein E1181_24340 [Saccharopolyspora terrae]|jgi:hypothetical protein|uniref:Uncharacterized protein n=1 Tax=Saccharopolyspora terrae TaxID=2530384 RepID=A0A4R4V946_9PSEU|nr:hypothetical protein [Saccharopolyspora terrae]TDD01858.1 hypothetical protein E1181_24340 [Saccharopolyspora terrae]
MNSAMVIALAAVILAIVFLMRVRTSMSRSHRVGDRRRKRAGSSFVGTSGAGSNHDGGWSGFDGGGFGGDGGGGSGGGDGGGGGGC